jgi:broad specificity phosphatase PhoE
MKKLVDAPITDLGKQQINEARSSVENIHIDKVFVSPLYRAL